MPRCYRDTMRRKGDIKTRKVWLGSGDRPIRIERGPTPSGRIGWLRVIQVAASVLNDVRSCLSLFSPSPIEVRLSACYALPFLCGYVHTQGQSSDHLLTPTPSPSFGPKWSWNCYPIEVVFFVVIPSYFIPLPTIRTDLSASSATTHRSSSWFCSKLEHGLPV